MRSLEMIRSLDNLPVLKIPEGYSIIGVNEDNGYLWEEVMDSSWGWHPAGSFREVMVANNGYEENRVFVMLNENGNAVATSSPWDYGIETWYDDTFPAFPEVAFVGVIKHCQGRGFGKVMTIHSLHELKNRGYKKAHLGIMGTAEGDNYSAVKTYINCGFVPYIVEEQHIDTWKKVHAHLSITDFEPIYRDLSKPYVEMPHPPRPWPYQLRCAAEAYRQGAYYVFGLWEEHNMYKVDADHFIQLKPLIKRFEKSDEFIKCIHENQVENIFIDHPCNPQALLLMKRDGTHYRAGTSKNERFEHGVNKYLEQKSTIKIKNRRYKLLTDFTRVYSFLEETYDPVTLNSYLLPQYFEYAHIHSYFDYFKTHHFGIWEEDSGNIVGIACYGMKMGDCHMHIKNGYEPLLPEMLAWAEKELSVINDGKYSLKVWITDKEPGKRELLQSNGYFLAHTEPVKAFDYSKPFVDGQIPDGFTLIDGKNVDYFKLHHCFWKGFDHGDNPDDDVNGRVFGCNAPHADMSLMTIAVASNGEYACALGMWFDKRNKYAYLEPLATVPKYRRMGLATVTLTEAMKKTKVLGAKYCFGGAGEFYTAIGFETICNRELWKREWEW